MGQLDCGEYQVENPSEFSEVILDSYKALYFQETENTWLRDLGIRQSDYEGYRMENA